MDLAISSSLSVANPVYFTILSMGSLSLSIILARSRFFCSMPCSIPCSIPYSTSAFPKLHISCTSLSNSSVMAMPKSSWRRFFFISEDTLREKRVFRIFDRISLGVETAYPFISIQHFITVRLILMYRATGNFDIIPQTIITNKSDTVLRKLFRTGFENPGNNCLVS